MDNKKINSYRAMASFVRAFFEAFTRGVVDANTEVTDSFDKKNDSKLIKQLMVEHYEEISHHYLETIFLALCRLNYTDFDQVEKAMSPAMRNNKGDEMEAYLKVACKSPQLYKAMVAEYKRNFYWLLEGRLTTLSEHVRDYTHGVLISLADETLAIHLLVRVILKAYAAGLQCGSADKSAPCSFHMPSIHAMLLNNVNLLLNEAPLTANSDDPIALFKEACKGKEENYNTLFNTLNDTMKELANG